MDTAMSTMPMMSPKPRAWTSPGDVLRAMSDQPKTARLKVQQVKESVRVGCGLQVVSDLKNRCARRSRRGNEAEMFLAPRSASSPRRLQSTTHNPPPTLTFDL